METFSILIVAVLIISFGALLAVKFGIQWALKDNASLLAKMMAHHNTSSTAINNVDEMSISSQEKKSLTERFQFKPKLGSPLIRLGLIGAICFISLIPIEMLSDVSYDRSRNAKYAVDRVAQSWGKDQIVRGPAIWIPYTVRTVKTEVTKDENGKEITKEVDAWIPRTMLFLPDTLNITADVQTQTRVSGIYPVPVYTAKINLSGVLPHIELQDSETIKYALDKAIMAIAVGDMIGLKKVDDLIIGDKRIEAKSGLGGNGAGNGKGVHFISSDILTSCSSSTNSCGFSVDLELNGVQRIDFSTVGKETYLNVIADWPHPGFYGNGLPDEKEITNDGFSANWHTGNLVRSYPQSGSGMEGMKQFDEYTLGVNFVQPINPYSMVERSIKYGLLVIGLTLIGMFIFEQAIRRQMHMAQYLVTTGALSLFYLTLLSLSEHIGFLSAWISASVIIIMMVSCYVGVALKSLKPTIGLAIFMTAVYTVMYALLRLEDYALLVGTGVLLIIMIVVMWVTRRLNQDNPSYS